MLRAFGDNSQMKSLNTLYLYSHYELLNLLSIDIIIIIEVYTDLLFEVIWRFFSFFGVFNDIFS